MVQQAITVVTTFVLTSALDPLTVTGIFMPTTSTSVTISTTSTTTKTLSSLSSSASTISTSSTPTTTALKTFYSTSQSASITSSFTIQASPASSTTPPSPTTQPPKPKLSSSQAEGLAFGLCIFIALLLVAIWLFYRRRNSRKQQFRNEFGRKGADVGMRGMSTDGRVGAGFDLRGASAEAMRAGLIDGTTVAETMIAGPEYGTGSYMEHGDAWARESREVGALVDRERERQRQWEIRKIREMREVADGVERSGEAPLIPPRNPSRVNSPVGGMAPGPLVIRRE